MTPGAERGSDRREILQQREKPDLGPVLRGKRGLLAEFTANSCAAEKPCKIAANLVEQNKNKCHKTR